MSKYRAILFDFHDTLAHIIDLHELTERTKKILGEQRFSVVQKHFVDWHTNNTPQQDVLENIVSEISANEDEEKIIKNFIAPKTYEIFPETKNVLFTLKESGFLLGLVSNTPSWTKKIIKELDLEKYFDTLVFSTDVGVLKPHKDIFLQAITTLGIAPQDGVMVGDSIEKDVVGAINAGLHGILLDRSGTADYPNKITNLNELLAVVSL